MNAIRARNTFQLVLPRVKRQMISFIQYKNVHKMRLNKNLLGHHKKNRIHGTMHAHAMICVAQLLSKQQELQPTTQKPHLI